MAGTLKRDNPDKSEDVVLIKALRDSNIPKFLSDDANLFEGIVSDLFPDVIIPDEDYGIFEEMAITVINLPRNIYSYNNDVKNINKLLIDIDRGWFATRKMYNKKSYSIA